MEADSVYVDNFLNYLENFVANIRMNDPLPVRAPSYKVTESEIDGQIIDIVYHYLNQRNCPAYIRCAVARNVWAQIRLPELNGGNEDSMDGMEQGNHIYEPVKLILDVTDRANKVLVGIKDSLSRSDVEALPRYLPVSQYAIRNTRRRMEDRHVIIQDLNTLYNMNYKQPHAYYGVFDGHAGTDAAIYTAAHLHQYLIQNPLYDLDPAAALKHAFHITDTHFIKKSDKERLKGGTTAVVALVREKRLVVAWLGDSQALLVRKRSPVHVAQPHKPDSPGERKRIEDSGGCVISIQGTWRVLGQLAVSRAIGDVEYKPYVSSECDIQSLEISGDEDFLILACDGLWDTLQPEAAVNIVYSYLALNDGESDGVGRCLVEAARSLGSEDNITAVVVFLRPIATLMEEEAVRVEQGQVPADLDSFVVSNNPTVPSSINSIFAPPPAERAPVNQQAIPDDVLTKDYLNQFRDIEEQLKKKAAEAEKEPSSAAGDSDSDEGVGTDIGDKESCSAEGTAAAPTDEEVDAALAELDSIPDGACEAGDVGDDDSDGEEEENWRYFNMKPQSERQEDDLLFGNEPQDTYSGDVEQQQQQLVQTSVDEPAVVPEPVAEAPSTSKTVEGFVTSVELNTSVENDVPLHAPDYFNTGHLEQNSGPFSVYVSNSPEPASIEAPPLQQQSVIAPATDEGQHPESVVSIGSANDITTEEGNSSPSVEIVHAQSMVEVITPGSPIQIEPPLMDADSVPILIPDIMTQSMTGDTHPDMFLPTQTYSSVTLGAINEQMEGMQINEDSHPQQIEDHLDHVQEQHPLPQQLEDHPEHVQEQPPLPQQLEDHPEHVQEQPPLPQQLEDHPEQVQEQPQVPPAAVFEPKLSALDVLEEFINNQNQYTASDTSNGFIMRPSPMKIIEPEATPSKLHQLIEHIKSPDLFSDNPAVVAEVPNEPVEPPAMFNLSVNEKVSFQPLSDTDLVKYLDHPVKTLEDIASPLEQVEREFVTIENESISPPAAITQIEKVVEPPKDKVKAPTPKPAPRTSPTKVASSPSTTKATPRLSAKEPSKPPSKTSRLTAAPRSSALSKPEEKKPALASRSTSATTRTASTRTATRTIAAKPTTTTAKALSKPSAATRPGSKPTAATTTTTTTRKPLTSSSIAAASTRTTKPTTTSASTTSRLTAPKRPITTRPMTTTTTRQSLTSRDAKSIATTKTATTVSSASVTSRLSAAPTTRKLIPTTRPATTKPISSTTSKDSKNTTNKLLSSTRTNRSVPASAPSKVAGPKTNTTAAARTTTRTGTTAQKRPSSGLKSGLATKTGSKGGLNVPPKVAAAAANGENKIVEEDSSVEVKDKLTQEDSQGGQSPPLERGGDTIPTKVAAVAEGTPELVHGVLVNGDH